jgi:N-acetylmuramoyl-L-alanine amidase
VRPDGRVAASRVARLRRLLAASGPAAVAVVAFTFVFAGTAATAAAPPVIAIDVGHSLSRPGAVSARGEPEFVFNRGLALVVERVLRQRGFRTRLIGEQGEMEKLTDRTAMAASVGAIFLLSLHHDSVQPQYLEAWRVEGRQLQHSDRFSGFSVFVSRSNPDPETSLACARAIGGQLNRSGFSHSPHHSEPISGENRSFADAANGVFYFDDLVVLKTAKMPAVLLEASIIVNRQDELLLRDASTRERLARAIADALQDCLGGRASTSAGAGNAAKR